MLQCCAVSCSVLQCVAMCACECVHIGVGVCVSMRVYMWLKIESRESYQQGDYMISPWEIIKAIFVRTMHTYMYEYRHACARLYSCGCVRVCVCTFLSHSLSLSNWCYSYHIVYSILQWEINVFHLFTLLIPIHIPAWRQQRCRWQETVRIAEIAHPVHYFFCFASATLSTCR